MTGSRSADAAHRVLSIPAGHAYTQAIRPDNATFLPDPNIDGKWWPHPALEASWWGADNPGAPGFSPDPDDVDIVHLHFGYDHLSPQEMSEFITAVHARGKALVATIHDIVNPHFDDEARSSQHREKVALLLKRADALLTLTECAKAALEEFPAARGRRIEVVAHPRIVAPDDIAQLSDAHRQPTVGVFLKSLRANVVRDVDFYTTVADAAPLTVYMHDVEATAHLAQALERRGVKVVRHAPMDDAELYQAISTHTTVLLPYLRGTHSGWLEMCRDLGATVAVPDCGCYAGQADTPRAVETYRTGDGESAAQALDSLNQRGPVAYAGSRAEQLADVRSHHARIYDEVALP